MVLQAFDYQKIGVRAIEDFGGRALLADDMGLGKTPQALWFLKRQKLDTLPALIICPSSVKYQWRDMAREHFGMEAVVLEGRTVPEVYTPEYNRPPLTIINPDILAAWLPCLLQMGIQTIVLDECQMFQNPTSKRTKAAFTLCKNIPHVLGMSGTPLLNTPSNIWPVLHMIRPDIFPGFYSFAHKYCGPRRTKWGWE